MLRAIDGYSPDQRTPSVLSELDVSLYQVRIVDLERLTELDFGIPAEYDVSTGEESLAAA